MKTILATSLLAALAVFGSAATLLADDGVPKGYPLTKCPVSDETLGEHGKVVKATAPDETVVYLCCKSCLKDFKKDPAKYSKMVKDAQAKK